LLTSLNIAGVAGAAIQGRQVPTGTLTCTPISPLGFPLKADCVAALAKVKPVKPEICLTVFKTESDYVTVGTCTVHTYSYHGKAHCLDGKLIIKGGKEILKRCTFENYTGGQYEWETATEGGEGVKLIRSKAPTA